MSSQGTRKNGCIFGDCTTEPCIKKHPMKTETAFCVGYNNGKVKFRVPVNKMVVWDKGLPVGGSPEELKRIGKRLKIIVKLLRDKGYKIETIGDYQKIMQELPKKDLGKYLDFCKEVEEIAKKQGC